MKKLLKIKSRFLFERKMRKKVEDTLFKKNKEIESSKTNLELALWASGESIWEYSVLNGSFKVVGFTRDHRRIERKSSLIDFLKNLHPDDIEIFKFQIDKNLQGVRDCIDLDFRLLINDAWVWHRIKGKCVEKDSNGIPLLIVGTVKNIQEEHQQKQYLEHLAKFDSLTGLLNRKTFLGELSKKINQTEIDNFCLIFVDLDGFKILNDSLGYLKGDEYLQQVAQTLKKELPKEALICRLGADEFIAAFHHCNDWEQIVQRLIEVKTPFDFPSQSGNVQVTGSIGVSLYPEHSLTVDALIDCADAAMQSAKNEGKDRYALYQPSMEENTKKKIGMLAELRDALENNLLQFYVQPKFDIHQKITDAELLCRWNSVTFGWVSPAVFIPLLEEHNLSEPLACRAIEHAIAYQKEFKKIGVKILLSVNISAKQILSEKFLNFCLKIFEENKIETDSVELEVTETLFIHDSDHAELSLNKLREAGFKVSMDDFGTGYSSLSYISRYHFDTIKIDQSFVRDMLVNRKARLLIDGIVSICHTLGMRIVAEGVETKEQFEVLKSLGVQGYQGFYLSRPVPFNELITKFQYQPLQI